MCMILPQRMDRRFSDRVLSKREDSRLVAVNPNHEVTHLGPPYMRRDTLHGDRIPFYAPRTRSASARTHNSLHPEAGRKLSNM